MQSQKVVKIVKSDAARAVKYPGVVQGSDVAVARAERADGELAFPHVAPKANVPTGRPRRTWDERLGTFVTRTAFSATADRPVEPSTRQRAALKSAKPEIDGSWPARQRALLAKPGEPTPATRPITFGGRSYPTQFASRDASHARFFVARKSGDGSVTTYRPEPGVSYWSDTPPGRAKPAHVREAETRAVAEKQNRAGKALARVDDATAAVRDLYNGLSAWDARRAAAMDAYRANPCGANAAAMADASRLPMSYPDLMRAAATDRRVEVLVYGVLDWYETWCESFRPTAPPDAVEFESWPPLARGAGDVVRQTEQTAWTVVIDGKARRQERVRWCSPEGHGMTEMDWDAAKEGGYYRLRRGRVGKRLRERAADLGWTFVYDTHDGKPVRTLVPYVAGEHRRLMVTIGGPTGQCRVGYSHRFPRTERFVPAAIETGGQIELVFIPYGKARHDKVTAFRAADGSECQTRGRNAPIVQYRTSRDAFARRDLRARDRGESSPYYFQSVAQRKASRLRTAQRNVEHAARLVRYAMGDDVAAALLKRLRTDQVLVLGRRIASHPELVA
jgi:hypothetical protein